MEDHTGTVAVPHPSPHSKPILSRVGGKHESDCGELIGESTVSHIRPSALSSTVVC
jgi:hypothetical protein